MTHISNIIAQTPLLQHVSLRLFKAGYARIQSTVITALLAVMLFAFAPLDARAETLTTTFASNNGQAGNMFDVDVLGNDINLTGISINARPGNYTFSFYYRTGSWQDNPNSAAGWTLHTSQPVTSAGTNVPTFVDIPDLNLSANTSYGFYVLINSPRIRYTNGNGVGNVFASDANIQIRQGSGKSGVFGFTFQPRVWNGILEYDVIVEDPKLAVTKTASPTGDVAVGTVITYTYDIENTGNTPFNGVSLTENHTGSGPTPVPGSESLLVDAGTAGDSTDATANNGVWDILGPGDTVRMTSTYVVTQTDVDNRQ